VRLENVIFEYLEKIKDSQINLASHRAREHLSLALAESIRKEVKKAREERLN
jgi:hypothetical protein